MFPGAVKYCPWSQLAHDPTRLEPGLAHFKVDLAKTRLQHNGVFYRDPANGVKEDSHTIVNALVSWTSLDEHFSVKPFGKTLLPSAIICSARWARHRPAFTGRRRRHANLA